jgi:predicted transcriptional regulator
MKATSQKAAAKQMSLHLEVGLKRRLIALATAQNCSLNSLISKAITEYLDEAEYQQKLLNDTLAAIEDYERTGLYLDSATANAWLDDLAAGRPTKRPKWQKRPQS